MVIGIGTLTLRLHGCRSLKEKRSIVKAYISRIRNSFNASVAETGANDIHHRAEIGFAVVGNSGSVVNAKLDKIINLAEDIGLAEVTDADLEIITL
ncbi:MAG: DUF503 domain-containing protein [Pseudomonadota bacterium]